MNTAAVRANRRKLLILAAIVLLCAAGYMLVEVNFSNPKLLAYAMKIRTPKLIVMLITAFSIGGASLVFQSIINNTIVTPCLLGMNSLYTLIHTAVVFFLGSASVVASNANLSFAVDVVLMGITATIIYSWIFKKTKHNVLYVLLVGTVLTSFFSSIQTTLTRVMDPNEYDNLLNTLVASFSNINSEIIVFSLILLASVIFALRKELALLDVLTLGKEQAINLGVDYDRCIRRLLLGVKRMPGSTVTVRFSSSNSRIWFIRVVSIMMPCSIGTEEPTRPVPAPLGVTGIVFSYAYFMIAAISSADFAFTTTSG